jgi:hypothetical protein
MAEEPLIYTTKGNLPIASLERLDGWEFGQSCINYWEEYRLDGEIVKRSVAVYQFPIGTELNLTQGAIG